ncbi:MAG: T9SS type A sorting domain-containing protein, partial [Flavobacteriales bacterium]|nr:T9SS type A sorting domain-containing protein [Flavobacteriales bacterium]
QTYTWTVPADHNGIPIKLNDLKVVVYVAEGNEDIISGSEVDLSIASPNAYDALPLNIDLPDYVCGNEVTPKVTIQNMGNETMTDLVISYNVNGGPIQTHNWTGSLATAGTEEVTLPTMTFTHLGVNTFWVSTSAPNGQADMVTSNDNSTKTFEPAKNSGSAVDITINTDNYGSETTWSVVDAGGATVASGGPYTNVNGGETFVENLTGLSSGCHTFVINDSYGDGICCSWGNGSFTIESGGTTLYTGGEFGSSDDRTFDVGGTNSIDDLELVSGVNVYPNPFKNEALVSFNLVEKTNVSLNVYNVLGATVIAENFGEKAAGGHTFTLASDGLEAGVYMVNLIAGDTYHT